MSKPLTLREHATSTLWDEILRRKAMRDSGRCDYCGGTAADPVCEFPERHPEHNHLLECYAAAAALTEGQVSP